MVRVADAGIGHREAVVSSALLALPVAERPSEWRRIGGGDPRINVRLRMVEAGCA